MSAAHGHVIPNPDGWKARCGGPALCSECAAELAQVQGAAARAAGAREALLSLAAELDRRSHQHLRPVSHAYASAARIASQRAQASPEAPSTTSPAQEDPDLTLVGLSPAQAYEAGVKAERERIALLLDRKRAVFCRPCDGEVCDYSDELAPASELVRGGGDG